MRLKLGALRKLKKKKKKDFEAKNAPVVQRSRLVRAARIGKIAELDHLLGKGKTDCVVDEFEVYGLNALHVAAKLGHTKFVEALLKKKASPKARARGGTTQGWTPLHFAYD